MTDPGHCFPREASLNELLREPIIAMMMTSDGVQSDDIRALFRRMAEKDRARERALSRGNFDRRAIP